MSDREAVHAGNRRRTNIRWRDHARALAPQYLQSLMKYGNATSRCSQDMADFLRDHETIKIDELDFTGSDRAIRDRLSGLFTRIVELGKEDASLLSSLVVAPDDRNVQTLTIDEIHSLPIRVPAQLVLRAKPFLSPSGALLPSDDPAWACLRVYDWTSASKGSRGVTQLVEHADSSRVSSLITSLPTSSSGSQVLSLTSPLAPATSHELDLLAGVAPGSAQRRLASDLGFEAVAAAAAAAAAAVGGGMRDVSGSSAASAAEASDADANRGAGAGMPPIFHSQSSLALPVQMMSVTTVHPSDFDTSAGAVDGPTADAADSEAGPSLPPRAKRARASAVAAVAAATAAATGARGRARGRAGFDSAAATAADSSSDMMAQPSSSASSSASLAAATAAAAAAAAIAAAGANPGPGLLVPPPTLAAVPHTGPLPLPHQHAHPQMLHHHSQPLTSHALESQTASNGFQHQDQNQHQQVPPLPQQMMPQLQPGHPQAAATVSSSPATVALIRAHRAATQMMPSSAAAAAVAAVAATAQSKVLIEAAATLLPRLGVPRRSIRAVTAQLAASPDAARALIAGFDSLNALAVSEAEAILAEEEGPKAVSNAEKRRTRREGEIGSSDDADDDDEEEEGNDTSLKNDGGTGRRKRTEGSRQARAMKAGMEAVWTEFFERIGVKDVYGQSTRVVGPDAPAGSWPT